MSIIMWFICIWYTFQIGLRQISQPKELYVWEEIETSQENYFTGMTIKKMQHHEH